MGVENIVVAGKQISKYSALKNVFFERKKAHVIAFILEENEI